MLNPNMDSKNEGHLCYKISVKVNRIDTDQ